MQKNWYRLDNVAAMHSLCFTKRSTFVFRISCFLKCAVKISELQIAYERTMQRFPYYNVTMERGFFWNYWQKNMSTEEVIRDSRYPCGYMALHKKGVVPLRLIAFQNSISCEFHHSITDGGGGLQFLRTLLVEYFALQSISLSKNSDVKRFGEQISAEEYEDSFLSRYQQKVPQPEKKINAVRISDKMLPTGIFHTTHGVIDSVQLLAISKETNVTLTEYISSVYLFVLQKYFSKNTKKRGPIRILIPVNLRTLLASKTMRNFFLWTTPTIDTRLGIYTFEDILKNVHHHMKMTVDKKEMMRQLKVNVGSRLNYGLRLLPLVFKKILIGLIYGSLGEKEHSGVVTNLGVVTLPEEIEKEVSSFEFVPPPVPITKISCAMVSYNNKLKITFGSLIKDKTVEREFFRFLVKKGIHVKIEANYMEDADALLY